ncbi:MAG TPA: phosphotransferase, partial [Acidimicrobiales bacterium]|nr:phosphotransferase [Acidimicrobiales bacterium]
MHRPLLEGRTALSDALSAWTHAQLGASVAAIEQWHFSVGSVAITRLTDGRRVALKVFRPRWTAPFLRAVVAVQRHLVDRGLPCPTPIAGPVPLSTSDPALVCAEAVLDDPGWPSGRLGQRELEASAAGLAHLVIIAGELSADLVEPLFAHPLRTPDGALYPEPHSPVFDFVATARGAEWIDQLAAVALEARDGDMTAPVVAHTDWSARNVRVWPDGIRAFYDADSLALVTESTAAGIAAATWSARGDERDEIAPSPEAAAAWVAAYEAAGRELTEAQRHAAGGAVLHAL